VNTYEDRNVYANKRQNFNCRLDRNLQFVIAVGYAVSDKVRFLKDRSRIKNHIRHPVYCDSLSITSEARKAKQGLADCVTVNDSNQHRRIDMVVVDQNVYFCLILVFFLTPAINDRSRRFCLIASFREGEGGGGRALDGMKSYLRC
jgi:hypothetical protein